MAKPEPPRKRPGRPLIGGERLSVLLQLRIDPELAATIETHRKKAGLATTAEAVRDMIRLAAWKK